MFSWLLAYSDGGLGKRTGREMFKGQRMILERRIQIGLRQMPGVTGFGKKAQIGQFQRFDQLGLFDQAALLDVFAKRRMGEKERQH
jgi:hypothetical protein